MTLTAPPIAWPPNNSTAGPRSTSIRSDVSGSIVTAWSAEVLDTSIEPMPSVSTRIRSPWKPRSTGRDAPGEKLVAETPGSRVSVSPSCGRTSRCSSSPLITDLPARMSSSRTSRPVTTIAPSSSWWAARSSSWVTGGGAGAGCAVCAKAGAARTVEARRGNQSHEELRWFAARLRCYIITRQAWCDEPARCVDERCRRVNERRTGGSGRRCYRPFIESPLPAARVPAQRHARTYAFEGHSMKSSLLAGTAVLSLALAACATVPADTVVTVPACRRRRCSRRAGAAAPVAVPNNILLAEWTGPV